MNLFEERVILVDEHDAPQGTMEKMEAHERGLLHRAFSIFLFNSSGELLLQQRALGKYHSGGLWTNTCCSHPRVGETVEEAAVRRLREEMGLEAHMQRAFHFIYRAELDHGMIEHELDHVLIGVSDAPPQINPEEVASHRHVALEELQSEMAHHPERFTAWFRICFPEVLTRVHPIP